MIETRKINLPQGSSLELTATPAFYDAIRHQFGMKPDEPVTDEHLRMFVFGTFKSALDQAEQEMTKNDEGQRDTE